MARGKSQAIKLRTVLPLGAVTLFSLFLFFWILPFQEFNPLSGIDFTAITFVFWLAFVGLLLIALGIVAMPEMKNTPARIAGFFFIAFGLIAFVFAVIIMIDGNINQIMSDVNLRFFVTLLFGVASVILLVDLVPRLISKKGMIETVANF